MESLGRYKLVRKIGSGGMAEVYLARAYGAQGIEKQLVVKKVLPTLVRNAHFITMFVDEAAVAARLNHPNIVQVYNFEQIGRDYVLAMEYVDGPDLTRLVVASRRAGSYLPAPIAAYIVQEVAKGLDYAHNRRDERGDPLEIVHRDVSPQNLLISYDGTVKIADFGIARARRLGEEGAGVIKGKFAYMSPEQAAGAEVDRRSDIFSLAVVLHELLTGRPLFHGKPGADVLEAVKTARIPAPREIRPDIPEALDTIVMRALARDPAERYGSARALAADIARYLHSLDEIVDSSTLEAFVNKVLPRREGAAAAGATDEPRGQEPAPLPTVAFQKGRTPHETREKLNVVAVAGKLGGLESIRTAIGERRAAARVRELLHIVEEISFKQDGVVTTAEDGFLIYLGLPLSGVDDPVRAVRLGLDVLDAADGLSYDLPSPMHLGIGINRGPARVVRDSDGRVQDHEPYGTLATVAQRLAEDAGSGEIRAGGGVYRLSRRDFNFEELPPLAVVDSDTAGDSQATGSAGEQKLRKARVYRLIGAKTRAERSEVRSEGPLLGRDLELQRLRDVYREAVAGNKARFVWIVGEMGIGKTRLANELLARTETGARRVVRGDSTFATRDLPLGAVADLVRDACGIGEDDRPEAARNKLAATLTRLRATGEGGGHVPVLSGLLGVGVPDAAAQPEDAGARQGLLRDALRHLLEGLARSQPVVAILENIHFADTPSLEALQWLAAQEIKRPLVGLALGRPDDRAARLLSDFERIVLRQLGDQDRVRLVLDRLGDSEEARDLARQICARTGGNPFFVNEVIESLIDRKVVRFEGEERRLRVDRRKPIQVPTTLEGVIAARIDEIPPEERLLLRWASVAGATFKESELHQLAGGEVKGLLRKLVKRRILVVRPTEGGDAEKAEGDPQYAFRYQVMREVAYDGLVGTDRAQMHRRMAAMLEGSEQGKKGGLAARVAMHLERAGDLEAAARRYVEAADTARGSYSNKDALRLYARAIALLPESSRDRFFVHEHREQILRGLGRRREQMAELDAMRKIAQALAEPPLLALSYNRLARLHLDLGRLPLASKALAVALESARQAQDIGAEVEALRQLAVLAKDEGHYLRAIECCDEALNLVGRTTDALKQRGTILISRGTVLQQMGKLREAVESYAEALVIYKRLGIKRLQAHTLEAMGTAARSLGDYEDAIALFRKSLRLDQEINDRYTVGQKLCNLGLTYAEVGDLQRALQHLRQAVDVNERLGDGAGIEETLVALAEVLLAVGATREAQETLARAERQMAEAGSRYVAVRAQLMHADLALGDGRDEDAAAAARRAAKAAHASGMLTSEIHAQVRLALALARQGKGSRDEAEAAIRRGLDLLQQTGQVERAELVHLMCGEACELLGLCAAARQAFERARDEVAARRGRLKSQDLRRLYDALPRVAAIEKACLRLELPPRETAPRTNGTSPSGARDG